MGNDMKYNLRYLLAIIVLVAHAVLAENNPQTIPTYFYPAQTINVSAAMPTFIIKLKANPTTGYSWITENYNKQLLTLVSYQYEPPSSKLIGAGGVAVWTFKVTSQGLQKPMATKISLLYARPWNLNDNPKRVIFTVSNNN